MSQLARLIGFPAALSLCGCLHLPPGRSERPLPPLLPPALVDQLARSGSAVSVAESKELEVRDGYRIERIKLEASGDQAAEPPRIVIEYYRLDRERSPVILLLPMAGGRYNIERKFARYFAERGIAVILAYLTRNSRKPEIKAIDSWVKQSVEDNRRALDWIQDRAELDSNRIALFGISMGSIKGALLAGVDHRIKAAVLGLAGGDLPYILTHTAEPKISQQRKELMSKHGMTLAQLQAKLENSIRWDPKFVASHIHPRPVFMVLGAFDTIVPFKKGWELRRALGKPETLVLPTGHYTAALCIPYIKWQSLRFFRQHLEVTPQRPQSLPPKDPGD